ncbi:MAG: type II toxin-antitoxin system YafQ family toxin [bacterium]|nr:type II toxin-antitoxin system YafQ family toxin [bacterium]
MKYRVRASRQYRKDYKKIIRSGKDVSKLEKVIDTIAAGKKLEEKHKDHPLKEGLKGKRECHITADWLLLYEKHDDELLLLLLRTGDHRHVLNIE